MDKCYKYILYALWLIGIITIGFITHRYFCIENNSSLLGAFGILISAFLASVTMARSYAQNERFNQEEKKNNELKIKKFALLAALDIYHTYNKNDNSLKNLRKLKHEYADRIEMSSELLKEFYNDLYLAVELFYEEPEEPIITKVSISNNRLLTEADLLQIQHPFTRIENK